MVSPLTIEAVRRSLPARFLPLFASCWVWAVALRGCAGRAGDQPLRYLLDLSKPASHRLWVTMTIAGAAPATEIQFPAWTNLYQMRNLVRDVRDLKARCDGRSQKLARLDRNTWRSGPQSCSDLEVSYAVRANEESPFSSALSKQHAFLNFGTLLFFLPQERGRGVRVKFILPAGWKMATLLEGERDEFKSSNYDNLVDSPTEAGEFQEYRYTQEGSGPDPAGDGARQGGAMYRVVVYADPTAYSAVPNLGQRLLDSIRKITATETALMHDVPFSRYTFILHFQRRGGGGGMEHRYGTAISLPAAGLLQNWGQLETTLAHEFFHLWNVKRIRPQGLEPVDYTHGNDTSDLWFSEGVTSYYQELVLLRAGMINRETFYARLAAEIGRLEERPARLSQSVEQSGRDAWLEKYRAYNRPNRSISYYNKGELLGLLLDLGIRHASRNQHSLDDVMRRLNEDFARRGRFFTRADLRALIARFSPAFADLDGFFPDYVSGTRELEYDTYLEFAGLHLLSAPAGPKGKIAYRLQEILSPTPEQLQVREGWLGGKTEQ